MNLLARCLNRCAAPIAISPVVLMVPIVVAVLQASIKEDCKSNGYSSAGSCDVDAKKDQSSHDYSGANFTKSNDKNSGKNGKK